MGRTGFFQVVPPWQMLLLFGAAFFLRLFLAPYEGFREDLIVNLHYGEQAIAHGVTSVPDLFTGTDSEMLPPLFIYQDALVNRFARVRLDTIATQYPAVGDIWKRVRFKMLPIAYDLLTGMVILLVLARVAPPPWSLLGAVFYLFNPCVFLNSGLWGQFDSIHCFYILLTVLGSVNAVVTGRDRWWVFAWIAWALAMGSKLQSIVIFPLLVVLTVLRAKPRAGGAAIIACALTFLALYAPFLFAHRLDYLERVFVRSFTRYAVTQSSAFNLWGLGYIVPSGTRVLGLISYARIGQLLYGASVLWLCGCVVRCTRAQNSAPQIWHSHTVAAAYAGVSAFMVLTSMHERYIAPAVVFLVIGACLDKPMRWLLAGFSLTYTLNIFFVLRAHGAPAEQVPVLNASGAALRLFSSLLNAGMFGWFTVRLPQLLAAETPGMSPSIQAAPLSRESCE